MIKYIVGQFILKVKRPSFVLMLRRSQVFAQELVGSCIIRQVWFFRPDFNGNKTAKCKCLARKARDKKVFI